MGNCKACKAKDAKDAKDAKEYFVTLSWLSFWLHAHQPALVCIPVDAEEPCHTRVKKEHGHIMVTRPCRMMFIGVLHLRCPRDMSEAAPKGQKMSKVSFNALLGHKESPRVEQSTTTKRNGELKSNCEKKLFDVPVSLILKNLESFCDYDYLFEEQTPVALCSL